MARGFQSVMFLGNVVRDPIYKVTVNGKSYCRFSIAVENRYRKGDKYIKATEFYNLVAWDKLAEYCEKFIMQGTRLFVHATPKNYKPQNSKYSTVLFTLSFLNIEGGWKTDKKAAAPIMEEEQIYMSRELPEDAEAIQREIDNYDYFEEEDYSAL